MLSLALDTATAAVTVAVAEDDEVLAAAVVQDARRHGEELAPAIAAVLAESRVAVNDMSIIGVGVGPGPFTGLRVGLMTARALALAVGVPVVGVCTLDLLAAEAVAGGLHEEFLVATDARRKEVYWARYDGRREGAHARPPADTAGIEEPTVAVALHAARVEGPRVSPPAAISSAGPVVGEGALLYRDVFPDARDPSVPSAATLCRWLAQGLPTVEPLPLYLRRADAVVPGARKHVSSPNRR